MRGITAAMCALLVAACTGDDAGTGPQSGPARLAARPAAATTTAAPGTYTLGISAVKDTRLIVPGNAGSAALPLLIMLHGAGGDETPVDIVAGEAVARGVAVLIPKARGPTWDLAISGFGVDVPLIDRALEETFRRVRVDPRRIALAGFSDGGSYALTLGVANGDLFTHLVAFAPGFLSPVDRVGKPHVYIAHGTQDGITSARNSEQNIAPFLRTLGYAVQFRGFTGGHQVIPAEAATALDWFAATGS